MDINITERIAQCRVHIDEMQADIQDRVEANERTPVLPQIAVERGYKPMDARIETRRLLRGHYGKVYAQQWCPSSPHFLVSAAQDGNLILWNALTSNKIHAIPLRSSWVMSCTYSQSGQLVACGGLENVCYIYRLRDAQLSPASADPRITPSVELSGHDGYISSCRFVSDTEILTASGDSTCILWNVDRRQQLQHFQGHYGDVMSIATQGSTFISGSVDASVKLWDIRQRGGNVPVKTFRGHTADVNSVSFFPDGNAFISGSDDGSCRLYDARAVSQVNKFGADSSHSGVTSAAFSGTGRLLFTGYDDNGCLVYDTMTGRQISSLSHDNRVSCLSVNTFGTALCTGSWDAFLRIWC